VSSFSGCARLRSNRNALAKAAFNLLGKLNLFWLGIRALPSVKDFYLWFYLAFAVSSTMMPSQSDRHA